MPSQNISYNDRYMYDLLRTLFGVDKNTHSKDWNKSTCLLCGKRRSRDHSRRGVSSIICSRPGCISTHALKLPEESGTLEIHHYFHYVPVSQVPPDVAELSGGPVEQGSIRSSSIENVDHASRVVTRSMRRRQQELSGETPPIVRKSTKPTLQPFDMSSS